MRGAQPWRVVRTHMFQGRCRQCCGNQLQIPAAGLSRIAALATRGASGSATTQTVRYEPLVDSPSVDLSGKIPKPTSHIQSQASSDRRAAWKEYNSLLKDENIPLARLLASLPVPGGTSVSLGVLAAMLAHPVDTTSLIQITPLIAEAVDRTSPYKAARLLSSLVRRLGDLNMLSVIPEVVRLFMAKIDQADHSETTTQGINRVYRLMFNALGSCYRTTLPVPRASLPRPIHTQLRSLLLHMINMLDSIPSTSDPASRPQVEKPILKLLSSPPFFSSELGGVIDSYLASRHVEPVSPDRVEPITPLLGQDQPFVRTPNPHPSGLEATMLTESVAKTSDPGRPPQARDRHFSGSFEDIQPEVPVSVANGPGSSDAAQGEPPPPLPASIKRDIKNIIQSKSAKHPRKLIASLGRYLAPASGSPEAQLAPRAWSTFFHQASTHRLYNRSTLLSLAEHMPLAFRTAHVITPLMKNLSSMGDHTGAWSLWERLQSDEASTFKGNGRGTYVDRKALAEATRVRHAISGLNDAIALVDHLGRRRRKTPPATRHGSAEGSITLDAVNVNTLLNLCKLSGSPSIALRLWEAALPRWGVYLDDISLTIFLDTARFASESLNQGRESIRDRWRFLADENRQRRELDLSLSDPLSFASGSPSRDAYDAYNADGFSRGPTSVLLDPGGYQWRREHGVPPWFKARNLFREVVLTNWPWVVEEVKSPLDFDTGPYAGNASISALLHYWPISGIVSRRQDSKSTSDPSQSSTLRHDSRAGRQSSPFDLKKPVRPRPRGLRLPLLNARYTHIIPSPESFQSYIALLGYYRLPTEIPLALAWMKALGIVPTFKTMCMALMYVGDSQGARGPMRSWGPSGEVRLAGDDDVLRRWLQEWLGEDPHAEAEVAVEAIAETDTEALLEGETEAEAQLEREAVPQSRDNGERGAEVQSRDKGRVQSGSEGSRWSEVEGSAGTGEKPGKVPTQEDVAKYFWSLVDKNKGPITAL